MSRRYPRNIQNLQKQIAAANEPEAPPETLGTDPAPIPAPVPEPVPAEDPVPEPDAVALTEAAPAPEYWRSRFQTAEGMLRREREERSREQIGQQAQLQQMQQQLGDLQRQIDGGRDPVAELDLGQHFSAEQIAQHGEDHLRAVLRAAQRTLEPQLQLLLSREMAPLRQELEQARQSVAQVRRSRDGEVYEGFLQELSRRVPQWQELNGDPRFLQYLDQADEATGERRQDLLSLFEQRGDAARVARLFGEFLRQGAAPARDPHRRLLPDSSPDGGNPPPDLRPAITQAEIRQFQADVARGRYRGRPQEQAAMQQRIDQAYIGGRIG
ncbi:hypothetical protein D0B54_17995 [Solimonas sp. K1W22B-7]|uniref:hypothetical protein n=1 Tax=Solimonas sp. K1W22B-7 TaxID=2303331 RepID=UPI000E32FE99|nr:hypothetical protein [Solimonas sp. K1W22B-7]AXQ30453.1 hypothetical protein D0B54_17995 [Solimonas sp. K1W22B-7]